MPTGDNAPADELTALQWAAVAAALVTAGVHAYLGVQDLGGAFGIAFLVATGGFLAGIAAIVGNYRRRLVYLIGIPFTAGQIGLWFALNQPIPPVPPIELVDKVAQAVLVALLFVLYRRETGAARAS